MGCFVVCKISTDKSVARSLCDSRLSCVSKRLQNELVSDTVDSVKRRIDLYVT